MPPATNVPLSLTFTWNHKRVAPARGAQPSAETAVELYRQHVRSGAASVLVDGNAFAPVTAAPRPPDPSQALTLPDGRVYTALVCGREREDGTLEGWLEFVPHDGSLVLRSGRETAPPDLAHLEHWATGLAPAYLKGVLERTVAIATDLARQRRNAQRSA